MVFKPASPHGRPIKLRRAKNPRMILNWRWPNLKWRSGSRRKNFPTFLGKRKLDARLPITNHQLPVTHYEIRLRTRNGTVEQNVADRQTHRQTKEGDCRT